MAYIYHKCENLILTHFGPVQGQKGCTNIALEGGGGGGRYILHTSKVVQMSLKKFHVQSKYFAKFYTKTWIFPYFGPLRAHIPGGVIVHNNFKVMQQQTSR